MLLSVPQQQELYTMKKNRNLLIAGIMLSLVPFSVSSTENPAPIENEEPEATPGYIAPQQKSLDEINSLDADDKSLLKYKETLLSDVEPAVAITDDSRRVVVQQMTFVVDGREDVNLNLTGDLNSLKEKTIIVKEGIEYRIKVTFRVQHEIVSGLRYHHVVSRKGINVDKQSYMVGSYGPKVESHNYLTPPDEAPKGLISRGHYKIKSKLIDDDKNVHLAWEWSMDIKKDWE